MRWLVVAMLCLLVLGCGGEAQAQLFGKHNSADTQQLILMFAADEANNDPDNPYGYKMAPFFYRGGLFGGKRIGYSLVPVLKTPVQATLVEEQQAMLMHAAMARVQQQPRIQPVQPVQPAQQVRERIIYMIPQQAVQPAIQQPAQVIVPPVQSMPPQSAQLAPAPQPILQGRIQGEWRLVPGQ